MKKIKLLTSLVGLTGLSMGLVPTIASCGCSTGLQVEMVSKKKDREFNSDSNFCTYLFLTNDVDNVDKIKVKLINLTIDGAETKSVSGLIKYTYDSAGNIKVMIDTNTLLTQWPNCQKVTFDLLFTNKTNGQTYTFTDFNLTFNEWMELVDITSTSWSKIIKRANQYYDGEITEDEFAATFCDTDQNQIKSIDDLAVAGLTRTIYLNGVEHTVQLVGTSQDTIADDETITELRGEKALLTFHLTGVVRNSDDAQNGMQCIYDDTDNKNYTTSQLIEHLNSTGSVVWTNSAQTDSCLTMLSDEEKGTKEVVDAIKSTNHYVATLNGDDWSTGTVTPDTLYTGKLFIPSYYNIISETSENCKETQSNNPTYKFYADVYEKGQLTRWLMARNNSWLSSPNTSVTNYAWLITTKGATGAGAQKKYYKGWNIGLLWESPLLSASNH